MKSDELFDEIVEELSARGATAGTMFGKRALKAHGKAFACLKGDVLAFKLGAGSQSHEAALALPAAELFDPSGKDRPFRDWVAIPVAHAEQWRRFAEIALDGLAG